MPAAAVIPAPIAYIKVVAVKKLVVGFRGRGYSLGLRVRWRVAVLTCHVSPSLVVPGSFTAKKLECSKQAIAVNTLAWNNKIGLWFYFVGF